MGLPRGGGTRDGGSYKGENAIEGVFDGNGNLVGQGFLGAKNESQWRETFDTYLKMAEEQMGESAA